MNGKESIRPLFWALLAWVGQAIIVWVVVAHQSVEPVVMSRYSARHTLLVALVVSVFVGGTAWLMGRWRALSDVAASLDALAARRPSTAVVPLATGALALGAVALFRDLIDLILPAGALLVGATLAYVGSARFVFSSLGEPARRAVGAGVSLVLLSAGLACGVAEVTLRLVPPMRAYRVLPEGLRTSFDPDPGIMPGVSGPSDFTTNDRGIRGDPYPPSGYYNILAIGGSTTECAYLDDTEAWPHLLQARLNGVAARPPVWVGNVGRSGHSLVEHILVLRHFVPQLEIDAVVVVSGINDLVSAWRNPATYDAAKHSPDAAGYYLHRAFAKRPLYDQALGRPFPESAAVFNLAEMAYWRLLQATESPFRYLYLETQAGRSYVERRRIYREAAAVIDELPDLAPSLDQYQRNLHTLVGDARRLGVRLVLATQPTMYHEALSPTGFRMLWLGRRTDGDYRYSVEVMAQAMDLFNRRLLSVCDGEDVECVDLAAEMNGVEPYFYDDVHFNEAGAEVVADLIATSFR